MNDVEARAQAWTVHSTSKQASRERRVERPTWLAAVDPSTRLHARPELRVPPRCARVHVSRVVKVGALDGSFRTQNRFTVGVLWCPIGVSPQQVINPSCRPHE